MYNFSRAVDGSFFLTSLLKEKTRDSDAAGSSPRLTDHQTGRPMFPPSQTLAQPTANMVSPPASVALSPVSLSLPSTPCLAPPPVPSASLPVTIALPPVLHKALPPAALVQPPVNAAAPTVTTTGPQELHAALPSLPLAPHPTSCAESISPSTPTSPPHSVPWPSSLVPGNYNQASLPYPAHPAQHHPSRSAFDHPVQATMCRASALNSSGPPQPQVTEVSLSVKEGDFALLKMTLDHPLNSHLHLTEQYKYQVLLGHLKLQKALQLAKAYMCCALKEGKRTI